MHLQFSIYFRQKLNKFVACLPNIGPSILINLLCRQHTKWEESQCGYIHAVFLCKASRVHHSSQQRVFLPVQLVSASQAK